MGSAAAWPQAPHCLPACPPACSPACPPAYLLRAEREDRFWSAQAGAGLCSVLPAAAADDLPRHAQAACSQARHSPQGIVHSGSCLGGCAAVVTPASQKAVGRAGGALGG